MSAVATLPSKPRATKLLAVPPESVEPKKPKVLIFGPPGVGKTWTALDFPSVFYIDTEGGADLSHYRDKLAKAGGMYLGPEQGSLDFDIVIEQLEALATEKHSFKTVVIDSITKLFATAIGDEQERLGDADAFGASKKKPVGKMKKLIRWLNRADMNVIVIAHEKDVWGKNEKGQQEVIAKSFDGWDKLEYELHLILQISTIGKGQHIKRFATVGKSRLTGFPNGDRFDWSFTSFAERYGKDVIEQDVKQIVLASPEQTAELARLLELVKLPDGVTEKWLKKADVDEYAEMDTETIGKCIAFLQDKLKG